MAASSFEASTDNAHRRYNLLLLVVAGLGGLLYGVDVGIIGGALPYLEATSHLDASQLATIVAAVLLGSVFSTIFAGSLADWLGRKPMMLISGTIFAISIPVIALSHGYGLLLLGRLLQGASGGLIGVVVPLYLAECLPASSRGKGTGVFQWLLTFGIVTAALLGIYYSYRVAATSRLHDPGALFHAQDSAWRHIFWVSLAPGVLFTLLALLLTESPRWLFSKGRREDAATALRRSRPPAMIAREMEEMAEAQGDGRDAAQAAAGVSARGSLWQRRYVLPFLLSCLILCCNTATGVNSIIGYNTEILIGGGLSDLAAHWGYVLFTTVNFLLTMVGMLLVDRWGRRALLMAGTSGIVVSMLVAAWVAHGAEARVVDVRSAVQEQVGPDGQLRFLFSPAEAAELYRRGGVDPGPEQARNSSLVVIYSYGGFTGATSPVRSDGGTGSAISITRGSALPATAVEAFFRNPLSSLAAARNAPLRIDRARLSPVPPAVEGYRLELALLLFIASFAMGPGVCVWLALSELMPTRIRSVGMSVALVLNQFVSTLVALVFLPVVSKYGYSTVFAIFAGTGLVYLVSVWLFLPETRGKTLEEVAQLFAGS